MADDMRVRALHRGLDVLEFLGANGASSLHDIHVGTGLPKSSLRRLLRTLADRHFIRVGLSDRLYRSNIATMLSVIPDNSLRISRLVAASQKHLLNLTGQLKWPVDLHFFTGDRLRILESTHVQSPVTPGWDVHVDIELNVFVAASGLAFLSCLEESEVRDIYDRCSANWFSSPERFGVGVRELLKRLDDCRKNGFATRWTSQTRQDNRLAIAVAILDNGRPLGAVAVAWHKNFMSAENFARQYLGEIRNTAALISTDFNTINMTGKLEPAKSLPKMRTAYTRRKTAAPAT